MSGGGKSKYLHGPPTRLVSSSHIIFLTFFSVFGKKDAEEHHHHLFFSTSGDDVITESFPHKQTSLFNVPKDALLASFYNKNTPKLGMEIFSF